MSLDHGPILDLTERDRKGLTFVLPRKSAEQVLEIFNYAAACALHNRDVKRAVVARCLACWMELKLKAAEPYS